MSVFFLLDPFQTLPILFCKFFLVLADLAGAFFLVLPDLEGVRLRVEHVLVERNLPGEGSETKVAVAKSGDWQKR